MFRSGIFPEGRCLSVNKGYAVKNRVPIVYFSTVYVKSKPKLPTDEKFLFFVRVSPPVPKLLGRYLSDWLSAHFGHFIMKNNAALLSIGPLPPTCG